MIPKLTASSTRATRAAALRRARISGRRNVTRQRTGWMLEQKEILALIRMAWADGQDGVLNKAYRFALHKIVDANNAEEVNPWIARLSCKS